MKNPADSNSSRFCAGSQKSRAAQAQARARAQSQAQTVCLPPEDPEADGGAAPQKQGSHILAHFKAGKWFFNHWQ